MTCEVERTLTLQLLGCWFFFFFFFFGGRRKEGRMVDRLFPVSTVFLEGTIEGDGFIYILYGDKSQRGSMYKGGDQLEMCVTHSIISKDDWIKSSFQN